MLVMQNFRQLFSPEALKLPPSLKVCRKDFTTVALATCSPSLEIKFIVKIQLCMLAWMHCSAHLKK